VSQNVDFLLGRLFVLGDNAVIRVG
jgi:hypothetical protein